MIIKNKICKQCETLIGNNTRSGLCSKCREKIWVKEHRQQSNKIKNKWLLNNPEKRKDVVFKDNNGIGKERKMNWYDNFWFEGKRKILLKTHPYCCRCGKTEMLCVHHRDNLGLISPIQNNDWSNLIVLCFPCHMEIHRKKEKPYYVGK